MSRSYTIGRAEQHQSEVSSMFRYHADQTVSLFQEAAWIWNDTNGQRFAVAALEPQAHAMEVVKEKLIRQQSMLVAAKAIAEESERAAADAREMMEGVEQTAALGLNHIQESRDNAAHALTSIGRVLNGCDDVVSGVQSLGSVPI